MEDWISNLADISLFVAVVQANSFSAAASRMNLPPATLSRRIAALERRVGMTLLLRTTRQVQLAPGAKTYYARCLEVWEAAQRAQAALAPDPHRTARVRVAMPVDLGVALIGPVLSAHATQSPKLELSFDLSTQAVDMFRDPVDLAFRIGKPLDDRVVARKMGVIASGIYAQARWLRAQAPISDARQLEALPCISLKTARGPMDWSLGRRRWTGPPGPVRMEANSVALVRTLAEDGHGLALLPQHAVAHSLAAGHLARILPDELTPEWPLYAVTATRMTPPAVSEVIERVRQALREQGGAI